MADQIPKADATPAGMPDKGYFLLCHGDGSVDFICDGEVHALPDVKVPRGCHVSLVMEEPFLFRVRVFRMLENDEDEVTVCERVIPEDWIKPNDRPTLERWAAAGWPIIEGD